MKSRSLYALIIIKLLFLILILENQMNISFKGDFQIRNSSVLSLTPHSPIRIQNDNNFTDYGFTGYGNRTHPYIIEELSIITSESYGIYVEDTTKHFVIRYCFIDASISGIYIFYAAEETAIIANNTCKNNNIGINIFHTSKTFVTNNTCTDNDSGIQLDNSLESNITYNKCTNNGFHGIYLQNCLSANVVNNTCNSNKICGVILYASFGSFIINNTSINNNIYGIYLDASWNTQIINNTIENNSHNGLHLYISDQCFIKCNAFIENNKYALFLETGSDENVIHHNTFHYNNLGGMSQACDNGLNNAFYEATTNQGNYWSNWQSGSYFIDGSANSVDPYPLGEPLVPIPEYLQRNFIITILMSCLVIVPFLLRRGKITN